MKEIRFRAWNKELKEMIEVDGCWFEEQGNYQETNLSEVAYGYILMQYTGLKDNKRTEKYPEGQRIFEGDILAYPNPTVKTVVRFGIYDNEELYEEYEYGSGFYLEKNGKCSGGMELNTSMIEVIGNIYENKELLK